MTGLCPPCFSPGQLHPAPPGRVGNVIDSGFYWELCSESRVSLIPFCFLSPAHLRQSHVVPRANAQEARAHRSRQEQSPEVSARHLARPRAGSWQAAQRGQKAPRVPPHDRFLLNKRWQIETSSLLLCCWSYGKRGGEPRQPLHDEVSGQRGFTAPSALPPGVGWRLPGAFRGGDSAPGGDQVESSRSLRCSHL